MSGPQIWFGLFMYGKLTLRPLISFTTNDAFSLLGGLKSHTSDFGGRGFHVLFPVWTRMFMFAFLLLLLCFYFLGPNHNCHFFCNAI